MRLTSISTLATAAVAAAATLQERKQCFGFDDHCGPWNMTVDGRDYKMSMNCPNDKGEQVWSEIDLNECLGNSWGKLVSGAGFKYTCAKYPEARPPVDPPKGGFRNPITIACQDGKGGNPVSYIELHYIMCNDNGIVRCQNQYDQHLHGL
ncbi:hypothetical protein PWT90_05575 [Aphanocladium album]|nr:hypothetical protein PWT90_05575 [Aphanocladium album]